MADWKYNLMRRCWEPTVPYPSTPAPLEAPAGTAYGDWPRCTWPSGCTIGVKGAKLCSPHAELVMAYDHKADLQDGTGATPTWQICRTCGVRGAMHDRLAGVEEAAAQVWLEENADVVLIPPPASAATGRVQRVPDTISVRSSSATPPLLPMDDVQAALAAGVPADNLARHLMPHSSSPKLRADAGPTSTAAAVRAAPGASTQRGRVLAVIVHAGDDGATDDQVSERIGLALNTVRPRRLELVEQGYVLDSGDTRATVTGSQATVWLASLTGLTAVADA